MEIRRHTDPMLQRKCGTVLLLRRGLRKGDAGRNCLTTISSKKQKLLVGSAGNPIARR